MGRPLPRREYNFSTFGSVMHRDDSLLVWTGAVGVVVSAFLFTPFFNYKCKKHVGSYILASQFKTSAHLYYVNETDFGFKLRGQRHR